jgi:hypothetical protein
MYIKIFFFKILNILKYVFLVTGASTPVSQSEFPLASSKDSELKAFFNPINPKQQCLPTPLSFLDHTSPHHNPLRYFKRPRRCPSPLPALTTHHCAHFPHLNLNPAANRAQHQPKPHSPSNSTDPPNIYVPPGTTPLTCSAQIRGNLSLERSKSPQFQPRTRRGLEREDLCEEKIEAAIWGARTDPCL